MSLDQDTFVALYRRTHEDLRRYAVRRVGSAFADDIVAEAFLVAWRRLDVVPDEPLPWLYGVAQRVIFNAERSARRSERLAVRMSEQAKLGPGYHVDFANDAVERLTIDEAMAKLPDRDQEILMLVAWEGLEVKGAAEALGCTTTAARVRLHRARRRLSNCLATPRHEQQVLSVEV